MSRSFRGDEPKPNEEVAWIEIIRKLVGGGGGDGGRAARQVRQLIELVLLKGRPGADLPRRAPTKQAIPRVRVAIPSPSPSEEEVKTILPPAGIRLAGGTPHTPRT